MNLLDECRTKKRMVFSNVFEAVELIHKLLQLADAPIDAVPSSEIPVTTDRDAIALSSELDKTKTRIIEF